MTIYLYVKTHNQTGLKYFGKTKQNPYKYRGSGKYWLNHIRKHGNDVNTEIVFQSTDQKEIEKIGKELSEKWKVTSDNSWANLKDETGDGGWDHINSDRDTFYLKKIGVKNPMLLEKSRKKSSKKHKQDYKDHIKIREKLSLEKYGTKHYSQNKEALEKRNAVLKEKYGVDNIAKRKETKEKLKRIRNSEEYKSKNYKICEYCGKKADPGNFNRWHGENCKKKEKLPNGIQ